MRKPKLPKVTRTRAAAVSTVAGFGLVVAGVFVLWGLGFALLVAGVAMAAAGLMVDVG